MVVLVERLCRVRVIWVWFFNQKLVSGLLFVAESKSSVMIPHSPCLI